MTFAAYDRARRGRSVWQVVGCALLVVLGPQVCRAGAVCQWSPMP